jgi:heptosyltransferase-2
MVALDRRPAADAGVEIGQPPTRVLVVRVDDIGDVVLTSSLLRALRAAWPAAHVSLLVRPGVVNLVEKSPRVDELLVYQPVSRPRLGVLTGVLRARRFAREQLEPRSFDLVIAPRFDIDASQATFLAYWSRAPQRLGFSEHAGPAKAERNRSFDRLLTHAVRPVGVRHEVERGFELLRALGLDPEEGSSLELSVASEDRNRVQELLAPYAGAGDSLSRQLVVLGVGAGHPKRRWPAERFASIARWLRIRGATPVVLAGPGEEAIAAEVSRAAGEGVIDLARRLTLRETGALLERAELFIGNDSGPMHMAAAVGVPIVMLSCHHDGADASAANSPLRFGPWGVESEILRPSGPRPGCDHECVADHAHCILGVTESDARAAATRLLQSPSEVVPSRTPAESRDDSLA